ncbi:MAG: hypothetical protein HS115_17745 [Spirochaetales bacterium]|nr:hypothetical protein [Spirochaetales bacterium]
MQEDESAEKRPVDFFEIPRNRTHVITEGEIRKGGLNPVPDRERPVVRIVAQEVDKQKN